MTDIKCAACKKGIKDGERYVRFNTTMDFVSLIKLNPYFCGSDVDIINVRICVHKKCAERVCKHEYAIRCW